MTKIKYHQYGIGPDYGVDRTLTNNWNPDMDYGNEYVDIHININTPSYDCNCNFKTEEERNAWYEEVHNLFQSFDIMDDSGFKVEHAKEKEAYLYAHPQQISGVIKKNDVKKVAEAISNMKLSSIRWVDLRETVYNISDEEYEKYLMGKEAVIRKELFTKAVTTRTSKYYNAFDVARNIADTIRMHRLGKNDGVNYGSGQTIEYILKIADQMIEEGYLKSFEKNECKYIRSLNKTEQKKENKFVA